MSAKLLKFQAAAQSELAEGMRHEALRDWMETHTRILGFWMDRLIEDGDSEDIVSMLHRQQSWLAMMQDRLVGG
ncbi:hypothetical protein [Hyphomonas sp.]|jgi:hypothetical protein|uniref:hypothetical protein n=1 Tax=Hyphomonas sp. TaxID=87 RepID=UPI000C585F58|nr:hypothetical protein [Hyphomonadaceae bacterium]MBA28625.1 hypothetical protein [Hyphomonadaceae bacterium]|tara:strand:+ start:2917 stop:3138 length:222 start_codon:yes stop_codon:yes gene_type:complete